MLPKTVPAEIATKIVISIVEREGTFLMLRRKNLDGCESWTFPGGKVEDYEKLTVAARREVKEEAGIDCEALNFVLGVRTHLITQALLCYIPCRYQSGNATVCEATKFTECAWMKPEDIEQAVGDRLFEKVREYITVRWNHSKSVLATD